MYSYDERIKAVKLYIQYDLSAASVIRELGYPDRHSLRLWYKEYIEKGDLKKKYSSCSMYTEDQKTVALEHYFEHGRCIARTVRSLGYPSKYLLREWIREKHPEERPPCREGRSLVNLSQQDKEEAVIALCSRESSAKEIANQYGVRRETLYNWKRQLLDEGSTDAMPKKKEANQSATENIDELKAEIASLQEQADALNREVYRLRLERDVLEKAAEIIKKDQGVSLNTLTNREKAIVIDALRNKYSLKELLAVFKMAKSSYCYQEAAMRAPDKYAELRPQIHEAFDESRKTYGYRRIHSVLKNSNIKVSEKVIRNLMKEEALVVYTKKKRKYNSYKGEITPAVENVIDRDFHADLPNEKWLTDITEFHIPDGKIYLSPVIDCFDGLPVSWTIGVSPDSELANTMLDCAISTLKPDEHPVVHSDYAEEKTMPKNCRNPVA